MCKEHISINMITDIVDIKGEQLNIGDLIAFGDTTGSYNAVIGYGEIVDILKKPVQTHVKVRVIKESGWCPQEGYIKTFIYPRNYHNLIKL